MSFRIDLSKTTDLLSRYHSQFMEQGSAEWPGEVGRVEMPKAFVRSAGEQWSGRAVASYYAMAQMAHLNQRLIALGCPVEVLAGAVQSFEDSYRTMTCCARLSRSLGRRSDGGVVRRVDPGSFVLFQTETDPLVALALASLVHFGFSFTLSVPIFDALGTIVTDDGISDVCLTVAASLEEDAEYGWGLLEWLSGRLDSRQHAQVRRMLPGIMAVFEQRCFGSAETLETLAGSEIIVEQEEPNLGVLSPTQHAAIFYHTMTETIFPKLQMMDIDGPALWRQHHQLKVIPVSQGMGVVAIDIMT